MLATAATQQQIIQGGNFNVFTGICGAILLSIELAPVLEEEELWSIIKCTAAFNSTINKITAVRYQLPLLILSPMFDYLSL